jgi:hypothetical protein
MFRLLCGAILLMTFVSGGTAQAGTLDVRLSNLWPAGPVRVELFDDAESWEKDKPMATRSFVAEAYRHTVRFDGLAPGRYAVRAEQGGPRTAVLGQYTRTRHGSSGSDFDRRLAFEAAAVEVVDDPAIALRLVATDH